MRHQCSRLYQGDETTGLARERPIAQSNLLLCANEFATVRSELMAPIVLRTSKVMFALVGGILGTGLVLGVLVVITRTSAAWRPTIILGCLLAAAMSVLLSAKLILTADAIHYRSLLV